MCWASRSWTSADRRTMSATRAINIEDHDRLLRYLRDCQRIARDEAPICRTLAGGVSNRTVWVERSGQADWVIKQALNKLRVQVDWFSAPERIQREAAGLRSFANVIPGHVPEFVFEDTENHILAMTAVPQPHDNWKALLLAGHIETAHARSFGRLLAKIHNAAEQIPALADQFAERRFFEELRLEPYYGYAAARAPQAAAFLNRLIRDTRARRFALVHGDYSPKNALLHQRKLIILDYEVLHFGDPAFDIGFSLTHFLSKAHRLSAHRDAFLDMARQYWQSYLNELRPDLRAPVQQFAVKHTLACLLARVAGRSPLEYLDGHERARQQRIVIALIGGGIDDVSDLIDAFGAELRRIRE